MFLNVIILISIAYDSIKIMSTSNWLSKSSKRPIQSVGTTGTRIARSLDSGGAPPAHPRTLGAAKYNITAPMWQHNIGQWTPLGEWVRGSEVECALATTPTHIQLAPIVNYVSRAHAIPHRMPRRAGAQQRSAKVCDTLNYIVYVCACIVFKCNMRPGCATTHIARPDVKCRNSRTKQLLHGAALSVGGVISSMNYGARVLCVRAFSCVRVYVAHALALWCGAGGGIALWLAGSGRGQSNSIWLRYEIRLWMSAQR